MRILITGGAGYIGSHVARLFASQGHEISIYDNLQRGHKAAALPGCLTEGDLADTAALTALMKAKHIEAVVHFAALTYVGESVREPANYYRNNVAGTLSLLDAMRAAGANRIVFSSTAAVYGAPKNIPITEDEPHAPINPYGRSKLAVEWVLGDYAEAYKIGFAALRYFNAAGASPTGGLGEDHDPETHLIPLILQSILGIRPSIEVFGTDYPTPDGSCIRDYIHVDDLAQAHLLALEKITPGQGRAFNLGTGRGFSVLEVIKACEEVTGKKVPVKFGPRRAGDPPELIASPARAMSELGWKPKYTELREIVETAWRWHKDHPRGYAS